MDIPIFRRMHIGHRPPPGAPEPAAGSAAGTDADGPFEPSLADVLVAKALLQRGRHLPLELVDAIADWAEYWPHSTTTVDYVAAHGKPLVAAARGGRTGRELCLRTPPIGLFRPPTSTTPANAPPEEAYTTASPVPRPLRPDEHDCPPDAGRRWIAAAASSSSSSPTDDPAWPSLTNPCRKIVFHIRSHDQGWASTGAARGSYQGSYSWFDVGHERFVQKNAPAAPGPPTLADLRSIVPPVVLVDPPTTVHMTPAPGVVNVAITTSPATAPVAPVPPPVTADDDATTTTTTTTTTPPTPDKVPEFDLPPVELPGPHRLQANRVALRQWTDHTIVWSWTDTDPGRVPRPAADDAAAHADGDGADDQTVSPLEQAGRGAATGDGAFVRQLLAGDVVTVWAKAVFPGWRNDVAKVSVKVYWAV